MEFAYMYVLLPLLIFIARVIDVSLETIRIIFVSKGFKIFSFFIGFFEILIWLLAINQIWSDLTNWWLYIAYAAGFATGSYVGIWLEEKISLGNAMITIIIRKNSKKLIDELKSNGHQLTIMDGMSGTEEKGVKIIFSVVRRRELRDIFEIIKRINPKAFFTVEDIRSTRKNEYNIIHHKVRSSKRK